MTLVTQEVNALGVAKCWKDTHFNYGKWRKNRMIGDTGQKHAALLALGDEPSPEAIADILGNWGWTATHCTECHAVNVTVVCLGEDPDYDSCTAWICIKCLRKAVELSK